MLGALCVFNFCGFFAFWKSENPKLFVWCFNQPLFSYLPLGQKALFFYTDLSDNKSTTRLKTFPVSFFLSSAVFKSCFPIELVTHEAMHLLIESPDFTFAYSKLLIFRLICSWSSTRFQAYTKQPSGGSFLSSCYKKTKKFREPPCCLQCYWFIFVLKLLLHISFHIVNALKRQQVRKLTIFASSNKTIHTLKHDS